MTASQMNTFGGKLMQERFAKFTLYLQAKHTYQWNLGRIQANPECSLNVAGIVFQKETDRGS